ncbi:hypothetical protein LOTGIDRAFT_61439, partial [Lottia gigantea]
PVKKYRFRKRDKVLFYGRKIMRKLGISLSNLIHVLYMYQEKMNIMNTDNSRLIDLTAQLSTLEYPAFTSLTSKGPPQSLLEAENDEEETDSRLPQEVIYMLRGVRVFGHLERPFFIELCKYMESISVKAGNHLFKVGDQDDSIYVVQTGKVNVYVAEKVKGGRGGKEDINIDDSIHSLLSILDVLTGYPSPYKTVSARAEVDSVILRLPAEAFRSMFDMYPESAVRVIQIIMIRLQRVTFLALHNYLGLSNELLTSVRLFISSHVIWNIVNLLVNFQPLMAAHRNLFTPWMKWGTEQKTINRGSAKNYLTVSIGLSSRGADLKIPAQEEAIHQGPKVLISDDLMRQPSDFDAACLRARVQQNETKSVTITGSPKHTRHVRDDNTVDNLSGVSEQTILQQAIKDLVEVLGIKNKSLTDGKVELKCFPAHSDIERQGSQDACVVFVVSGRLAMLQDIVGENQKEALLFTAVKGEVVGTLAVLTGEPSFFTIRAATDCRVAVITKEDFYFIMREEPFIVLNAAHTTVKRMSPFVRQIDFALDWERIEAGKALFRQGDNADCVYIILTGRLRTVIQLVGGKKELVGEYGRGELVGIVEVLTQTERATTAFAVRDTEVAKMPSGLLNVIKRRYPQIVTRLIHLLGERILGNLQNRNTRLYFLYDIYVTNIFTDNMSRPAVTNLATVAVLPISEDVPLTNFTLELQHALNGIGLTTRLSSEIIKTRLGAHALDSVNEFRVFSWLGQQEDLHRMVLYQCDFGHSRWNKYCMRQADCIIIVGLGHNEPTVGVVEKQLETVAAKAQKELVLLHKEDADTPRRTVEWLENRGWCSSHHHLRCPSRVLSKKSPERSRQIYEKLFQSEPDRLSDFSRLARFLTGTSIGLVLGGGGARGLAHVGMIRAMTEAGIPIDMVGGTSMGSFIGALWCEERNMTRFYQRAREWSFDMTSLWKKVFDLTYPVTSMFKGASFNTSIETVFKDRQVEDLWIPYFCITTDISNSTMRVHTSGNLWRYVRSSMSLSGYLPPLCDPADGHLLLDGGYVNNLPADVMRTIGAQTIFAIDVGSHDEDQLTNYGDELSGWWLLWNRWNPWAKPLKVPDMTEIQSRLAYVSCVRTLELVKNSDYCEYIRPPIDKYGTLQFGSFDEIADVGYIHGKTLFSGWIKGGLLDKLFEEK